MLIGLTGKAGSGKDTAGKILSQELGYSLYSFAKPLKDICDSLFGFSIEHREGALKEIVHIYTIHNWREGVITQCRNVFGSFFNEFSDDDILSQFQKQVLLPFLIAENDSISKATLNCSPRQIYQKFGTEFARFLRETIWVDLAGQALTEANGNLAITDVRFENEGKWVKANNGKVLLIKREEERKVEQHISESGLSEELIDVTIVNNYKADFNKEEAEKSLRVFEDAVLTCHSYLLEAPLISL